MHDGACEFACTVRIGRNSAQTSLRKTEVFFGRLVLFIVKTKLKDGRKIVDRFFCNMMHSIYFFELCISLLSYFIFSKNIMLSFYERKLRVKKKFFGTVINNLL